MAAKEKPLKDRFAAAKGRVEKLSKRPSNEQLLQLYALYKQATQGDNEDAKPGFADIVARAKWDAWKKLEGTGGEEAMQQYIDLIAELKQ